MERLQTPGITNLNRITKGRYREGIVYIVALLLGLLVSKALITPQYHRILIFALCALGGFGVGLRNWRWSIYGLLLYIPFAGVVIMAMYPSKAPLLFKDIFFVIPAYLGFLTSFAFRRERIFFKSAPVWLMGSFAGLVFIHLFNPYLLSRYNLLAGLIGAKVWLFCIPLYFLAYYLVNSREDLIRLAKVILYISLIPFSVGLIQAALVYSGYDYIVYQFYGPLAGRVTQEFVQFNFPGGGFLRRLPSIFQFGTQYYGYIISMLPLTGAMWIGSRGKGHWGWIAGLVTAAGMLSGIRRTFIFVPAFWLLFALFLGRFRSIIRLIVGLGLGILLTFSILEVPFQDVYKHIFGLTSYYSRTTISADFVEAVKTAPLGLGTGTDTNPARHALAEQSMFRWLSENFYAKVVYELGIPGLLIVVALFASILRTGYFNCRLVNNPLLKGFSAALLSFFIVVIVDSLKAQPLDFDPINVYFWMFAGLSAKLASLDNLSDRGGRARDG